MQITQWHNGTDKPVRDGVYQLKYYGINYSLFKNGTWMLPTPNFKTASKETWPTSNQELPWRGVTKP